jgi:hypothetical protein
MPLESGVTVDLTYVVEATHGTTPGTPAMKIWRTVGKNVNPQKNLLRSAELRADRLQARPRHGFRQWAGTIPFELANKTQDFALEAHLGPSPSIRCCAAGRLTI